MKKNPYNKTDLNQKRESFCLKKTQERQKVSEKIKKINAYSMQNMFIQLFKKQYPISFFLHDFPQL